LKPAWRYRDYVIDAFNADMPFDRFVREQVAGDLLPSSGIDDRRRQLVATAFLTIGNTNLEEQDKPQLVMDAVDEQVDTIGKAFLGQTIACARCHDHKFDPIPTADYYAIAAILRNTKTIEHANVSKWIEKPLPEPPEREAQIREHERVVADLESRIKAAGGGAAAGKSIVAAAELPGIVVDDAQARKVGEWTDSKFSKRYIASGYAHDGDTGKGEKTLTFQPDFPAAGEYEVRLAYVGGKGRSSDVPVTIQSADGENVVQVDMREAPPIAGRFVSLGKFRFEANGQGYVLVSNEGTTGHVVADAVIFLPAGTPESGSAAATGPMEAELKRLRKAGPRRAMALAVEETGQVVETRIHVRGSVHALGAVAPRGFLQVASPAGPPPMMPSHESGRRELAGWLAGPDNPLTARVFVNRAWHWLFGAGLVRTPDNFGTTGEAPSHPDLLDDLAAGFMADGWSTKRLVRRIVLSRTYRQDSAGDPRGREQDPENRRVGRANRRRLDAECLRDAILAVGGVLDLRMGGPSFPADLAADYGFVPTDSRRSVYAPAFRNALPEIFNTFDFADPSLVVGRRDASTVAPQALYLMNHPFVAEESRRAARRLLEQPCLDDSARLIQAYRIAIGRPPTEAERRVSLEFLAGDPDAEASWAMIFRALIASPEFRIID